MPCLRIQLRRYKAGSGAAAGGEPDTGEDSVMVLPVWWRGFAPRGRGRAPSPHSLLGTQPAYYTSHLYTPLAAGSQISLWICRLRRAGTSSSRIHCASSCGSSWQCEMSREPEAVFANAGENKM